MGPLRRFWRLPAADRSLFIKAALWLGAVLIGLQPLLGLLFWPLVITSLLTTCYTGFLFKQGLARDLWQGLVSALVAHH